MWHLTNLLLCLSVLISTVQVQAENSRLYFNIPDGWRVQKARATPDGRKMVIIRNRKNLTQTRLLLFDNENGQIADFHFNGSVYAIYSSDYELLLVSVGKHPEPPKTVYVLDRAGREILKLKDVEDAHPCLRGHEEMFLGHFFADSFGNKVTVLGTESGKVLARFGKAFNGFVPFGDSQHFAAALQNTVYMATYSEPEKKLWSYNVDGFLHSIWPLSDKLIRVRLSRGYQLVHAETGQILHTLKPGQGAWEHLPDIRRLSLDQNGNAIVTGFDGNRTVYYRLRITDPDFLTGKQQLAVEQVVPRMEGARPGTGPGVSQSGHVLKLEFPDWIPVRKSD